jgi:hypothetical protein
VSSELKFCEVVRFRVCLSPVPSLSQIATCTLAPLSSHTCGLGHAKHQDGCGKRNTCIYTSNLFIHSSVFPSYLFWIDKRDFLCVIQWRECHLRRPITTSLKLWEKVKLQSRNTDLPAAGVLVRELQCSTQQLTAVRRGEFASSVRIIYFIMFIFYIPSVWFVDYSASNSTMINGLESS